MSSVAGIVLGQANAPLASIAVTLTGAVEPRIVLTGTVGNFVFTDLVDGIYNIIAFAKDGNSLSQQAIKIDNGQNVQGIVLQLRSGVIDLTAEDARFVRLKYVQYIFLMVVGLIYFGLIAFGIRDLTVETLKNLEGARGVITYLVAVTTIAMAAMLMLAAIMTGGKDLDRRFALGKEILSLLIGVLGTIIGFYYGSTAKSGIAPSSNLPKPSSITVNEVRFSPTSPKLGKPLSVSLNLTGGTSPYTYSLAIMPAGTIEPIQNKSSSDGRINETMTFTTSAMPGSATLVVTGKDTKDSPFTKSQVIQLSN